MKKLFSSAVVLLACFNLSLATVRTVCNMSYAPGQYTTFAAALVASANFDTIYVHGSSINYGAITVSKSGIVIIGAGHNPAKLVPLPTSFTLINLNAFSCQFIGLSFDALNVVGPSGAITVKRCKLQAGGTTSGINFLSSPADNCLIEGNVFNSNSFPAISFSGWSSSNTIIRNNVFNSNLSSNSSSTIAFTFQISHNIFLGNMNAFFNISNAAINDNIFYRSSPQGAFGGAMNNNISFNCSNNNFAVPGINNLVNADPVFTTFPAGGALFDYSHNYALAAGSPGIATASDGTDRGVYGGFGSKFNMTGEPAIAEITAFTITSPTTIAPGGTLTISVTSSHIK